MSTAAPPGLMTADEFYDWANRPENADRLYELDAGRVIEVPSPGKLHAVYCWLVVKLLTDYLARRKAGYLCTNDTGLIVARDPDTVRGPDLMLYFQSAPIDQITRRHADDAPDLVVEVMSPSDRMGAVLRRVGQYHRKGVPLVWVVEPDAHTVHVYRPNEFPKVLDESDELAGNGALPDFQYKVADLFRMPG